MMKVTMLLILAFGMEHFVCVKVITLLSVTELLEERDKCSREMRQRSREREMVGLWNKECW